MNEILQCMVQHTLMEPETRYRYARRSSTKKWWAVVCVRVCIYVWLMTPPPPPPPGGASLNFQPKLGIWQIYMWGSKP